MDVSVTDTNETSFNIYEAKSVPVAVGSVFNLSYKNDAVNLTDGVQSINFEKSTYVPVVKSEADKQWSSHL